MKEGVKKSISLILVLTLLVQLLPVVAFGVGDETNDLDISTDSETVSMKDDDAEIVGEEDALREESVKHFRLRDGGYMLVEYETAVHYQTADGSWEEIDNTLQKTGQQYVAQAGDMTRKFAASLDSGFLFETAYQGQSVSMSLARRSSRDVVAVAPDVPAAEETAAPEETAASETADQLQEAEQTEADQTQEPAEAAAETDAPQQETAEELPLLDDAAYTLVTSTAAARMENPGAKMRTFSKLAEKDKIQPQKIRSSVAFDNVMDGVSLLYQNYGYNVKESIIIEKPQEQYAYSFVLNLQGLTPTLEADGSVLLRGADGRAGLRDPGTVSGGCRRRNVTGGCRLQARARLGRLSADRGGGPGVDERAGACLPRDARPDDPAAQQGQRSDDVHPVGMAGVCCPEFCRSICRV